MGIELLLGKTITNILVAADKSDMVFTTNDGKKYQMYHERDCCESVEIDDICGDLGDLLDSPILLAEEVSNKDDPPRGNDDSHTWTFYKLATINGSVTIRWYGESNGYYSEDVTFEEMKSYN